MKGIGKRGFAQVTVDKFGPGLILNIKGDSKMINEQILMVGSAITKSLRCRLFQPV